MRRRGSILVIAVIAGVLALGGCVFPRPPAGQPIPDMVVSSDKPDPVSGILTLTAAPVNFTPTEVEFRLDTNGGPPLSVDDTAPYSVTIDAATVAAGAHTVWVRATDGTYTVFQVRPFVTRPNFVVVLVDDMDARIMPLWDALPKTKAAIGDRGTTFTNAFAPDPLCCPARASLLTGKYPHNTGVLDLADYHEFVGGAENDTFATRLHAAGYRTGFAGKYLNGYDKDPVLVPPGWDEWFGLAGDGMYRGYGYEVNHNGTMESYGTAPADYETDVLSREATSFLNSAHGSPDQPFLLYLTPVAPHAWIPPAPRYAVNNFTSANPTSPGNLNEPDVSDKPEWLRDGVPVLGATALSQQVAEYQRMMGSLLAVDDMVASVVSNLKRNGEWASTTLVFLSDNGLNFGSHRLVQKEAPYEESIRVPMVMAGPGIPHENQSSLVTHEDLAPTLLDLAGLPVPDTMDGRSLRPVFAGDTSSWRSDFLLEFSGQYNPWVQYDTIEQSPIFRSRTTARCTCRRGGRCAVSDYIYIQWYGGTYHDYELYDLDADPLELTNLLATPAGRTEHADLVAQMQARLDALVNCSGLACR